MRTVVLESAVCRSLGCYRMLGHPKTPLRQRNGRIGSRTDVSDCWMLETFTKPQHQLRSTGDYCSVVNRWAATRVIRQIENDLRCESPRHHPIGDDDLSTRDIKSDHQETEVASTNNGPTAVTISGLCVVPNSKLEEPTSVTKHDERW